jgi:hypothetical protein
MDKKDTSSIADQALEGKEQTVTGGSMQPKPSGSRLATAAAGGPGPPVAATAGGQGFPEGPGKPTREPLRWKLNLAIAAANQVNPEDLEMCILANEGLTRASVDLEAQLRGNAAAEGISAASWQANLAALYNRSETSKGEAERSSKDSTRWRIELPAKPSTGL